MPSKTVRRFDLNVEKILEGWEIPHALREIIANALDEQALTGTKDATIAKDSEGLWHIRDYGRGLKYEHLTLNENKEKLRKADKVVGKFGYGLKDALATLHRRGIDVKIDSKFGTITLEITPKHDFADVKTLHAVISSPGNTKLVGTDFRFGNIGDCAIDKAKHLFLKFSGDTELDRTRHGQILQRTPESKARIYVKGVRVAEEEEFAFSYNITSLTTAMSRALNRERSHVSRSAYTDRVKAMLLASRSPVVAETLIKDLICMEQGTTHEEVKWVDVAVHACRILNASKKVVFVTAVERTREPDAINHAIVDGNEIVTLPGNVRQRLNGVKDLRGKLVRTLDVYKREFYESFRFVFVTIKGLSPAEREIFDMRHKIGSLVGGIPNKVKEIVISETMRPDLKAMCDAVGLWEADRGRIIIKRSELRSLPSFAGTLLHEMTHADTGCGDVTREFESGLTVALGKTAAHAIGNGRMNK